MSLAKLSAWHFRNLDEDWSPSEGVNLIVGPNAQGKTNLLEAVCLISTGRILRSARDDSAAIRTGESKAQVLGVLRESGTELKVTLGVGERRRAYLNNVALAKASDLMGRLPTTVFSNADLSIVREDAGERRRFLDQELAQIYPSYLRHFALYRRALDQRNALLKQVAFHPVEAASFEVWEDALAEHGQAMREYRIRFIDELQQIAGDMHRWLSSGENLRLEYVFPDRTELATLYREERNLDQKRGNTRHGPHRDDVLIELDGKEARTYGSQGQQRTAALSLKLSTIEVIHKTLGMLPMILLDDVLSELDFNRRSQLLDFVVGTQTQTILTCTEAEQAGSEVQKNAAIFRVTAGKVEGA